VWQVVVAGQAEGVFFVSAAMLAHVPRIAATDLTPYMAEDEVNIFLVGRLSEQLQNPM